MSHPPLAKPNPAAHNHVAPYSARAWCEECREFNGPMKGTLAYEMEELRIAWNAFVYDLLKPIEVLLTLLLRGLNWLRGASR